MKRLLCLLLAAPWVGSAVAQTSVYSPRADSTSITVYRDGIAQITETRRVDLPAGPVTLVLQGVVETLLPQSAVITGLERPRVENNYDFDALTPQSLLERSVGKQVTVVRTNRTRGTQTRSLATIVSAENGVVLRFDEGAEALHCAGLPERLEFSGIPEELTGKPMLSVKLQEGAAGPRTVTVSYLAQHFTWSANYVARLNDAANQLDLLGWVTLINGTDTSFREAQVQVVAGRLGILDEEEGGSRPDRSWMWDEEEGGDADDFDRLPSMMRIPACHPPASAEAIAPAPPRLGMVAASPLVSLSEEGLEEVQVTGSRITSREELGDYKLYRLDWPTDLNAHQTKQVAFLHAKRVEVERPYKVEYPLIPAVLYNRDEEAPVTVGLRWKNEKSAGLGEPLPTGRVAVFEQDTAGEIFAGEGQIEDLPVGGLVDFGYARALNLTVEHSLEPLAAKDDEVERIAERVSHRLLNFKEVPVKVEVQAKIAPYRWSTPAIRRASQRSRQKNGAPLWVITVPAGSEQRLSYEVRTESLD